MGALKVIIDYSDLPEGELDNFAQTVHDKLTGNANFTFGANDLTTLQASVTDYADKYEASRDGTKADTVAKNNARKVLLKQLNVLASTVNLQADGDEAKLLSSGFRLAQGSAPVGVRPKPEWLKVVSGNNSGELLFEMPPFKNVRVYCFFVALVPEPDDITQWRKITSTKSKVNEGGFIPGKKYAVRCAYQGTDETLVYSDTIYIFAQ